MARPRVFVSSTFFDLRQIRADLFRFITEIGYEPVLHEHGKVPYGKEKNLEHYCYEEIEGCDILVAIVGGRFGSPSLQKPYSISQMEFKTAFEQQKQVFIFVERSVYSEYHTYLKNKQLTNVQYHFVDNQAVFQFLEEIENLPKNNPIATFETAQEITDCLKEQWAGLFQRFLQEQGRLREIDLVGTLSASTKTLDQLVTFLTEERKNSDQAIRDILLINHPMFERIRQVTETSYRVFFISRTEMITWLKQRSYQPVDESAWDDAKHEEYLMKTAQSGIFKLLRIKRDIFESNGKLKVFTKEEWKNAWVTQREHIEEEEPPPKGGQPPQVAAVSSH